MDAIAVCVVVLSVLCGPASQAEPPSSPNLLRNPGFEEDFGPVWEKRTPEDAQRKLYRTKTVAHSGEWSAALENLAPTHTRLRQGHDRSVPAPPPGSLIELSAWVKSHLSEKGFATLQIYCMGEKDAILAQPVSKPLCGKADWTRLRVISPVPGGAKYCMAYLQINEGTGAAFFDDVSLRVIRPPRPASPPPKIAVATDLPEQDDCLQNLKLLLGTGFVSLRADSVADSLAECAGAMVLFRAGPPPAPVMDAIVRFAGQEKPVFMDIRNLAQWRGLKTAVAPLYPTNPQKPLSTAERMATGLRLVKQSRATAGFIVGQIIPYAGANGTLLALADMTAARDLDVLATTPDGQPALVQKGSIVAADILSLREPHYANVEAYYKYLFVSNTLINPVRFGEYYPKKLTYAQFVEKMKETAARYPTIRFQEEGPACGDYRIYSLNLGHEAAPLYFFYGATHGSEWEPGYGLLTFAKCVAEGQMNDVIDLNKVSIKIIPILNPSGYDLRQRHNAHKVDLNRQGDFHWNHFTGKDSTGDGAYGPGDYDWKGDSPFCEPEAKTYKRVTEAPNLYCVLDFHGNVSALNNKVAVLPAAAREDNFEHALDLQFIVNQRLRGRFILKQTDEKTFSLYLLDRVTMGGNTPFLMNTSARGRYGLIVELTAGYSESYGTVLQTDVTCEICRALFQAYRVAD